MELQHQLIRQAIDMAVTKAMGDIQNNAGRGLRYLVDLGLLFSSSDMQKAFFVEAQRTLANPKNPYPTLATRLVEDVEHDTLKRVGLNLGYNSLVYGAARLQKLYEMQRAAIPWLLVFDVAEPGMNRLHQLEHCVAEGVELGIYSYILDLHEVEHLLSACEVARRFDDCLFVIKTTSDLIQERTAHAIGRTTNAMASVQITGADLEGEAEAGASRLLREAHCIFGFHACYNEANAARLVKPELLQTAICMGFHYGVFIAEPGVSDACREAVYAFVRRERGACGKPLVPMEWELDMQFISERILSGRKNIPFFLPGNVYDEYRRARDSLTNALLDLLQGMQPLAICRPVS